MRLGIDAPVISEDWRTDRSKEFVADWAHAAQSTQSLKDMRLAQFGQMPGMGDIATDPSSFMQTLGPQVDQLIMSLIDDRMQAVSDEAVSEAVKADCRRFTVDEDLSEEAHRYASRFQVALEDLLGDVSRRWDMFGDIVDIEVVHV